MVKRLSGFLSKSESVFCEAVDSMNAVIENGSQSPFAPFDAFHALCRSHAFDEGDTSKIEWIKRQRNDVMDQINSRGFFHAQPGPLPELDSNEVYPLQAADFAGGIARELWQRTNTLVALFNAFDYVTYNSKRLSEADALKHTAAILKRQITH